MNYNTKKKKPQIIYKKRLKKSNDQKRPSRKIENNKIRRSKKKVSKNKRKPKETLVRVYGKYHCRHCNVRWASAGTYQSGDGSILYSQECLECGYGVYAHYIRDLCDDCGSWPCRCEHKVYGYYRCKKCKKVWESAYTFEERGTGYIIYPQQCKRCRVNNKAYRTEELLIPYDDDARKNDLEKPHLQALCGRCRHKQFPCNYQNFA